MTTLNLFLSKLLKIKDLDELEKIETNLIQEFEKELIQNESDVKKRAESRRDFYSRIREIHEEKETVQEYEIQRENRKFTAFGQQNYSGPIFPEELEYEEKEMKKPLKKSKRHPVFLDPLGRFYDINYLPLDFEGTEKRGRFSFIHNEHPKHYLKEKDAQNLLEYEFIYNPELYKNTPDAKNFATFDEYEFALLQWSKEVEQNLGYLQLPKIMGRHYYRPFVSQEKIPVKKTSHETWENNLIPTEPKPEFYTNYEEYEQAMIRWAIVCSDIPFLPPHCRQFQSLLGIAIHEQSEKKTTQRKQDFSEDKTNQKIIISKEWENLNEETRIKMKEIFNSCLTQRVENKKSFGTFHRNMYPVIHGTIPMKKSSQLKFQQTEIKENPQNVKDWLDSQRIERDFQTSVDSNFAIFALADDLLFHIPLRKYFVASDYLTGDIYQPDEKEEQAIKLFIEKELKLAYDCNEIENENHVEFKVPLFDIGKIPYGDLKPNYVQFLKLALKRLDHYSLNLSLMSTYFPKIPKSKHDKDLEKLEELLKNNQIIKLFQTDCYLDIFISFIDQKNIEISFDLFKEILNLLNDSNSKMVHGKVSHFIKNLLLKDQSFIMKSSLEELPLISKCVSFYDELPIQYFNYHLELDVYIKNFISNNEIELIYNIVKLYYFDFISLSLTPMIDQMEDLLNNISQSLEKNESFLRITIWKLSSSKSKMISDFGTFLLAFLMQLSFETRIYKLLSSIEFKFIDNVRKLAYSKMNHIQDSIRRIFQQLENKKWKVLLAQSYKETNLIIQDLFESAIELLDSINPPFISTLCLEFLSNNFKDDSLKLIQPLIEGKIFSKLLKEITKFYNNRKFHQGMIMSSIFIHKYLKFTLKNGILEIEGIKKEKGLFDGLFGSKKDKKDDSAKLVVNVEDLMTIIHLCFDDKRDKISEETRQNFIISLCHLMKLNGVLSLILEKEKNFTEKLLFLCKESEMNKFGWKLFYKTIKFNPSYVKIIRDSNLLLSFLEMMGNNGLPYSVTKNSIHYFTKILNLNRKYIPTTKQDEIIPPNEPNGSIQKEYPNVTQWIGDFIVSKKSYHIIHQSYVRYKEKQLDGWAFQSLVQFFETMMENKKLENLFTNYKKDNERMKTVDIISSIIKKNK